MAIDRLALFRTCLDGAVEAIGKTIQSNGWDPLSGSLAEAEIAAQGPFVRRTKEPVVDAYSVASVRLGVATQNVAALSRLLEEPFVLAAAVVARAILENAARAAWALDLELDVRMRVARGRTDKIKNLLEVLRYPFPAPGDEFSGDPLAEAGLKVRDEAIATLDAVVEDTEAIGLQVKRNNRGDILGVEESAPSATDTIDQLLGVEGTIAYRDLSAVAHGGLSSVLYRMETVEVRAGSAVMAPGDAVSALPFLAVALRALGIANDRRIQLFGWDRRHWIDWRRDAATAMKVIFPSEDSQHEA